MRFPSLDQKREDALPILFQKKGDDRREIRRKLPRPQGLALQFTTTAIEPVGSDAALYEGARGTLLAPGEAGRTRFNIGVTTLDDGASIRFSLRDGNGIAKAEASRTFGPRSFQHVSAADLLGATIAANDSVTVVIESGSALIYGAAIDSASGDTAYQLAGAH